MAPEGLLLPWLRPVGQWTFAWIWYTFISAVEIILCLAWLCSLGQPSGVGLRFAECSAQVRWYFWAFLRGGSSVTPRSPWCSLCLQTVNKCQYSLLTHVWCLLRCAVLGSSPRQPLFQAQIFLPLDGRGSSRQGMTSPQSRCYREGLSEGWDPSSVGWLFGKPAWPSLPGRGSRPAGSAGPPLPSPCVPRDAVWAHATSRKSWGLGGTISRTSGNLGGKGNEWLLGVWLRACNPSSHPAMPTKVALWACFLQKWRQRSNT